MGTNYYLRKSKCKECGNEEEIHIGKSSFGWTFALHIYPEKGINNLKDWAEDWKRGKIYNEYNRRIYLLEMFDIITEIYL